MINVIIIEDITDYRNGLKSVFTLSDGFSCAGAYSSGEEAMLYLPDMPCANVALVDIGLPGMNGIELIKEIKKICPQLLCIMCTSIDEDEKVFEALEAGAFGYILKSSPVTKILDAVADVHIGGSPMSSEIARKVMLRLHKKGPAVKTDFNLTPRETEVIQLLSQGLMYKEIAATHNVTLDTVKRHCFNIYEKMHVSNRTEAVNKFEGR